jgi:hypothetical protein
MVVSRVGGGRRRCIRKYHKNIKNSLIFRKCFCAEKKYLLLDIFLLIQQNINRLKHDHSLVVLLGFSPGSTLCWKIIILDDDHLSKYTVNLNSISKAKYYESIS